MCKTKRNVIIKLCALLILAPLCVPSKLLFNAKIWNACVANTFRQRAIVGISLEECIKECGRRSSCGYIVYLRHAHLCQVFDDLISEDFLPSGRGCVVINREDIDASMFTDQCSCNEGETCTKGACHYEECLPPALENGGFIGNMYAVGSRLKIYCWHDYGEVNSQTSIKCGLSGTWSYNASCTPTIECSNLTFANGELVGTANGVGAIRTIVCHTGYEEDLGETEVQCEISGSWNYTPTCNIIIECGDITFANGELVGTADGVGAIRTIVCHTGYEENLGETDVQCEISGSWNYTPTCNVICPSDNGHSSGSFHIKVFHKRSHKENRDEANDLCIADGGYLVKINETWKMDFLDDLLRSCSSYSEPDYWTDGKKYNGLWLFSDNTRMPMENRFWEEGTPDGSYDDACARIKSEGGIYLWNDQRCTESSRFICEY